MANPVQEARGEIAKRALALASLVPSDGRRAEIRQQAHKPAGMAAQFEAPDIARAADEIEQACAAGLASPDRLAVLEAAIKIMEK
jgi:HPt (histidine-containing phosphotransfer) domain-containing protein